jgi:hypothetical protein
MSLAHAMRSLWHTLPYAVALAIAPLTLGNCTDLIEFRTPIARLRADLHDNTQVLSHLSERVDELECRHADAESAVRQTQQDLSQAMVK